MMPDAASATQSVAQFMDLSGRRALVAGGAGHIALAVEETLIELGASVIVLDLDAAACQQRVERLSQLRPGSAIPLACDLADEIQTRQSVRTATQQMGGLEILVHCAAYSHAANGDGWTGPLEQQTVKAWDAALRVNVTSAFVLVQEARAALERSGHGSVIFFGSIYGTVGPDVRLYTDTPLSNSVAYGVAKGGLAQLTRYLATLLAPRVRVNMISPGGVWRNSPQAFVERYIARTPLGRMCTEEDLKGAVAYLASDLSTYVTGQNLQVDGGWTIW